MTSCLVVLAVGALVARKMIGNLAYFPGGYSLVGLAICGVDFGVEREGRPRRARAGERPGAVLSGVSAAAALR